MKFTHTHKALLITALISGIVVMAMFSFHITKQAALITESYFEITPPTPEEEKLLENLEALEKASSKTNNAYNEDEEFKKLMKNFKSLSHDDFKNNTKTPQKTSASESETTTSSQSVITSNTEGQSISQKELNAYKKAKAVLAMHSDKKEDKNEKGNSASTLTYSLKGRELIRYNTPRYLCEDSGKIVVNITVNASGKVTDTYINTSSSTTNQCLTQHALEYAESVIFDSATLKSQIGTITFYFKGKS